MCTYCHSSSTAACAYVPYDDAGLFTRHFLLAMLVCVHIACMHTNISALPPCLCNGGVPASQLLAGGVRTHARMRATTALHTRKCTASASNEQGASIAASGRARMHALHRMCASYHAVTSTSIYVPPAGAEIMGCTFGSGTTILF